MPIVSCVICGAPARSASRSMARCLHCIKSRACETDSVVMPFDITVNIATLEKADRQMAECVEKAARTSNELIIGLTRDPAHSSLRCFKCVDNKDGTFSLSRVGLVVVPRQRAVTESMDLCNPGLWDACFTERQCAGVSLYCDVLSKILYARLDGITIHAQEMEIVKTVMCFFASLVKDPGADEVYKARYIALNGGSPDDKVCDVCKKVGDFGECQRCKSGVYICGPDCQQSLHPAVCYALVKAPAHMKTAVRTLHLAQEIDVFTTKPEDFFRRHYCKPVLSRICEVCGAAAKHKCNTCKNVYYCSKTCQVLAFPVHKRLHHLLGPRAANRADLE